MKSMVRISLRLSGRKKDALQSGEMPVLVRVSTQGDGVLIRTGISCRPEDWDARTSMCVGRNARGKNMALDALLVSVRNAVLSLQASGEWQAIEDNSKAKEAIMRVVDGSQGNGSGGLLTYFDGVISRDRSRSPRTLDLYRWTLDRLRDYFGGSDPGFDSVKSSTLKDLEAWLRRGGSSVNTISVHMRNLRAVFNQAIDEGATENYPFRRYRVRSEVPLPKVLSVEEFRELWRAECLPDERRYLDIFFLGFLFRGMNIVDLSRLKEVDRDGYVSYRRSKTGYEYRIKVEPEAEEIIRRNRGQKLLIRTFENRDHLDVCSRLNHILKKVGGFGEVQGNGFRKRLPINDRLSYAWGRRSWATFAEELGVSLDTIRLALGHQIAGTARHYVKYNQSAVDEANRRVIDWVLYGKE